jgi:hypothetical protein
MLKSFNYDLAPLQSKKFLAYMFSSIVTKVYLFYATRTKVDDIIIMTTIISSMFLDIGYILGQASLDKAVRMAAIIAGQDPPKET